MSPTTPFLFVLHDHTHYNPQRYDGQVATATWSLTPLSTAVFLLYGSLGKLLISPCRFEQQTFLTLDLPIKLITEKTLSPSFTQSNFGATLQGHLWLMCCNVGKPKTPLPLEVHSNSSTMMSLSFFLYDTVASYISVITIHHSCNISDIQCKLFPLGFLRQRLKEGNDFYSS